MAGKYSLQESIIVPSRMVFIMWLIFFIESKFHYDFGFLGVFPRTLQGLLGVVTMPLVHGSVYHVSGNTFPVLILGSMLYYFYPKYASMVFLQSYFFTNLLVWIFGRQAIHIGASGMIFSLASFLIFYGFFRKDFKSVILSGIVMAIYGSMFLQIIPANPVISWESHLLGAVVGITNAFLLGRNTKIFSKK